MKKNIFFGMKLSLFLMLSNNLLAQEGNANISNQNTNFKTLMGRSGYKSKLETEGSPYLYTDYKKAKIANNTQIYDLKYNAYKDEIEIINNGRTMTIFKNSDYSPIHIIDSDETIYLMDYPYKGKNVNGYLFEVKKMKDLTIFMRISKTYDKAKYAETSFDKDQPEIYTDLPDVFYVQKPDGKITEMPDTKKKLIEMFPDKKSKIEQSIKENKIDTRKLNTLSQLFTALS